MAKRIHVAALRGTSPDAIREAYPKLAGMELEERDGWCWFVASVWSVGASEIIERLEQVGACLLVATTEDACRWYLQLRRGGVEPYATVHEFGFSGGGDADRDELCEDWEEEAGEEMLGEIGPPAIPVRGIASLEWRDPYFEPYEEPEEYDEEDDEDEGDEERDYEGSALDRLRLGYEELGVSLSGSILDALEGLPDEAVYGRFLALHAGEVCDALARFGIAHDRGRVTDVLTGETVTEIEDDWDIGNLPRFLSVLGLGGQFDVLVADAEREQGERDSAGPEDFAASVVAAMREVDTVALERPVTLPVAEAPLLFRAGYWCHPSVAGAFTAVLPDGAAYVAGEDVPSYVSVCVADGTVGIGGIGSEAFLVLTPMRRMGEVIAGLPEGSRLTLHLQSESTACQRYKGKIAGGMWEIGAVYPPVSEARIEEAITLFREVAEGGAVCARDAAEADGIAAELAEDFTFHDEMPDREGLVFRTMRRRRDDLGAVFWRRRYGDVFDCATAVAENRDNLARWRETQREMEAGEQLPVTEQVIYAGEASRYLELDAALAAADEMLAAGLAEREKVSGEFEGIGFRILGDMVCERVGLPVIRAFVNEDEGAYGVHYAGVFGTHWCELYTAFADGTSLTSTTGFTEGSIAELRILMHFVGEEAPAGLLACHREGLRILADRGINDVVLEPSLEGMARAVDAFLLKRLPDEA